ncbi:MAG: NAD(P)/FAD-dependent oxidoreductase [Phycisphaerae bacterium]
MNAPDNKKRVVIVGGGFGGVYTAAALEKATASVKDTDITLISRDNYLLITPLLFEAGSGVLDPRHTVCPVRQLLHRTRFIMADVTHIDVESRHVAAVHQPGGHRYNVEYDQLVLAVGGVTNRAIIPGSEHAMAFKTLADAMALRNRIIDAFEQADVESDAARKKQLLTIVIIGAGLVGVELVGELTHFLSNICGTYKHIQYDQIKVLVCEAGATFLKEMPPQADFARTVLEKRGVEIRINTPVAQISPNGVTLPDKTFIPTNLTLLCAGLASHPLLADLPLPKQHGRIVVEPTMRCQTRPEIWAIGDCAWIPDREGKPYPQLAQHALREARVLADNICRNGRGEPLVPFVYKSLGTLAALGHYDGIGRVMKLQVRGFAAWWIWRTYYLLQMPHWSRRLRVMIDWTVALFFHNDIVKLDMNSNPRTELKEDDPDAAAKPGK